MSTELLQLIYPSLATIFAPTQAPLIVYISIDIFIIQDYTKIICDGEIKKKHFFGCDKI